MRTISVGHSPDADDIFMFYAIAFGWISTPKIHFVNTALDIETLNTMAINGTFDISAISFALYPKICNDQALLRTGVSFGEGYGPKLIKRKGAILKRNFKVALSGEHTTNALIFRAKFPQAKVIYKNFLEIESAVLSGEVDAGVLIHESILNFDASLEVVAEIWDIWCELTSSELPLPLGGMCLRRSLPLNIAITCEKMLTWAIVVALKHKELLSKMLIERNLVRVDAKDLQKYLNLYANTHSITLNSKQIEGINALFKLGYDYGFYTQAILAEDYLIPTEYETLRNS